MAQATTPGGDFTAPTGPVNFTPQWVAAGPVIGWSPEGTPVLDKTPSLYWKTNFKLWFFLTMGLLVLSDFQPTMAAAFAGIIFARAVFSVVAHRGA